MRKIMRVSNGKRLVSNIVQFGGRTHITLILQEFPSSGTEIGLNNSLNFVLSSNHLSFEKQLVSFRKVGTTASYWVGNGLEVSFRIKLSNTNYSTIDISIDSNFQM
jgi:hypothetical protein